ncbi:DUF4352 domain-containing protein [Listeria booriae]|uniref:DUF4352 domain-containing protein n=2 Tax=Listeria booriae TaxID=1552123 RepID=A0A7X0YZM0_9LIST|nr:DUF4352 domain-containing protein [Listeria booriae]MBC1212070.1 DUF4352 domain-containing protein [Listeria booriae]MBC1317653.1 DUF4352 domain-containing protein [Listeria booriae]MBC1561952.1 DUF4352 domain-containing protein [Listeria booriae]MBC2166260.1 DUF4352 domain-containing protein [Listeria booriae]MBC2244819.1 DUF4352 domain-containing protein [Listeria booriae]
MKKTLIAIFASLVLITALAGCGTKQDDTDLNKALGNKEITVTPTKVTREKATSDRKAILKVVVQVKNNSKKAIGIGAGNFNLKDDDGKNYDNYGLKADSLGQELEAGKTVTGNIYYEIPADLEKGWMDYAASLGQEPAAEWLLAFPKK